MKIDYKDTSIESGVDLNLTMVVSVFLSHFSLFSLTFFFVCFSEMLIEMCDFNKNKVSFQKIKMSHKNINNMLYKLK